jgi:hypothetical protein
MKQITVCSTAATILTTSISALHGVLVPCTNATTALPFPQINISTATSILLLLLLLLLL